MWAQLLEIIFAVLQCAKCNFPSNIRKPLHLQAGPQHSYRNVRLGYFQVLVNLESTVHFEKRKADILECSNKCTAKICCILFYLYLTYWYFLLWKHCYGALRQKWKGQLIYCTIHYRKLVTKKIRKPLHVCGIIQTDLFV